LSSLQTHTGTCLVQLLVAIKTYYNSDLPHTILPLVAASLFAANAAITNSSRFSDTRAPVVLLFMAFIAAQGYLSPSSSSAAAAFSTSISSSFLDIDTTKTSSSSSSNNNNNNVITFWLHQLISSGCPSIIMFASFIYPTDLFPTTFSLVTLAVSSHMFNNASRCEMLLATCPSAGGRYSAVMKWLVRWLSPLSLVGKSLGSVLLANYSNWLSLPLLVSSSTTTTNTTTMRSWLDPIAFLFKKPSSPLNGEDTLMVFSCKSVNAWMQLVLGLGLGLHIAAAAEQRARLRFARTVNDVGMEWRLEKSRHRWFSRVVELVVLSVCVWTVVDVVVMIGGGGDGDGER